MSPWNYPFLLTMDPLVDALAAGNTAVLKPSAYSPHTSEIMKEIVRECFEEPYVTAVTGGRAENTCLLQESFDYIFFTGSQAVGKEVMKQAAAHLTPSPWSWRKKPLRRGKNSQSETGRQTDCLRQIPQLRANLRGS